MDIKESFKALEELGIYSTVYADYRILVRLLKIFLVSLKVDRVVKKRFEFIQ